MSTNKGIDFEDLPELKRELLALAHQWAHQDGLGWCKEFDAIVSRIINKDDAPKENREEHVRKFRAFSKPKEFINVTGSVTVSAEFKLGGSLEITAGPYRPTAFQPNDVITIEQVNEIGEYMYIVVPFLAAEAFVDLFKSIAVMYQPHENQTIMIAPDDL